MISCDLLVSKQLLQILRFVLDIVYKTTITNITSELITTRMFAFMYDCMHVCMCAICIFPCFPHTYSRARLPPDTRLCRLSVPAQQLAAHGPMPSLVAWALLFPSKKTTLCFSAIKALHMLNIFAEAAFAARQGPPRKHILDLKADKRPINRYDALLRGRAARSLLNKCLSTIKSLC